MTMTALEGAGARTARPAARTGHRWPLRRLVPLVGPALFLLGWCVLALVYRHARPEVMPAPWSVASNLGRVWRAGLGGNIIASVKVAAGGWVLGSAAAIVVGVTIGRVHWLREIVNPVIEVLRPVSALVWVPLAVVWFGIGYESKVFVVSLATFFIAIVHVVRGAQASDPRHLKAARMLSLRRRDVYRYVVVPSAVPEIMLGLRLGLGVAWGGVIIAELVAGGQGVGAMELLAQQGYDFDTVVIGMAVFAVLGLVTIGLFSLAERLLLPWLAAQRRGAMAGPALTVNPGMRGGPVKLLQAARALLGLVILIGGWWLAVDALGTSSVVLPTPGAVASTLRHLLSQHAFLIDIQASLEEFAIGYALALVTALVASAIFVLVPIVHRALWNEIELLRFVIPFSWIPLAVLWFSTSMTGKIFVVWYAVFFTVILSAYDGLASVDALYLKAGRMLRLPLWRQMIQIRLRAALPRLLSGAMVGVGVGWISVIAAEYVGSENGLGVFITNAQQTLDTKSVIAAMVVIGVIGALLSLLARVVSTRLSQLRGGSR